MDALAVIKNGTPVPEGFWRTFDRQLAAVNDLDDVMNKSAILEGCIAAFKRRGHDVDELGRAQALAEVRIGELLGKPPGPGARTDLTVPREVQLPRNRIHEFRKMAYPAKHNRIVREAIAAGHWRRSQRLRAVERIYQHAAIPPGSHVVNSLADLKGLRFGCIYADPPWKYGNQGTRAATSNHYQTLSLDELSGWPVSSIAADDAHLHLWTTNAFLPGAFQVIEAWGFEYRSCFVWVKPQMGIGNYWRVSHEFLLLGIRGNAKSFKSRTLRSWGQYKRGRHSSKPEEVRLAIEEASPGPYLELFGRKPVDGWTVLGDSIEERLFA